MKRKITAKTQRRKEKNEKHITAKAQRRKEKEKGSKLAFLVPQRRRDANENVKKNIIAKTQRKCKGIQARLFQVGLQPWGVYQYIRNENKVQVRLKSCYEYR